MDGTQSYETEKIYVWELRSKAMTYGLDLVASACCMLGGSVEVYTHNFKSKSSLGVNLRVILACQRSPQMSLALH